MNYQHSEDKNIRRVRALVWVYFWLLIFEGALRKWVVPDLSNPLLIVRDPVVLLVYYFAIKGRVFPKNFWIYSLGMLGFLSMALSFLVLWPYIPPTPIALVTAFGFRSNFLHLPLIFVMARTFRMEDVKRLGWWTLIVMVPMALLMVGQFRAAPDAFLNRTAGGEGEMMLSALGKVRTAGTFSFVIGVVSYCSITCAFLIWAALRRDVYKNWLLFAAGGALLIAIAVSGSRSVVGACVVVAASLVLLLFLRPDKVNRFGQTLLVGVVLAVVVSKLPIFKEGFNVLSTRFNEVAEASDQSIGRGLIERVFSDFADGFFVLTKAPFLGYGLGIGTNAGAKFLVGRSMFLLSEGEWSRIFLESGPVLGLAYVIWRCAMAGYAFVLSLRSARGGNMLPLLLFAAGFLPMLSGQFGQPTILGFAVFTLGLCLAARNGDVETVVEPPIYTDPRSAARQARVPGRSAFANQLHGPPVQPEHVNGSVDR